MSLRRGAFGWFALRRFALMMIALGVCVAARAQTGTTLALLLPSGVVYDSAGNCFFADTLKNQVYEVSLAGVSSVVAGTGAQGFAGDGGPATAALLNAPAGVAVASDGTVYIADTGNQRVRAVVRGQIQTVAGNGARGFLDGGADARLGMLHTPMALAMDATGGVLIADSGNHRVRRLAAGRLTTVAGSGMQGFAGDGAAAVSALLDTPMGVAVASDGRIFLADSHNHRLRVVAGNGRIATFAGSGVRGFGGDGGLATGAALYLPRGVSVTADGDVLLADSDNHRVRRVDASGTISTVAGDGMQGMSVDGTVVAQASLDSPRGVAVSTAGAAVFSDSRNRVVQTIAGDRMLYTLAPATARGATVTVGGGRSFVYGQGSVPVAVQSAAPSPTGTVTLIDGTAVFASGTLLEGGAILAVDALSAGKHSITAAFAGDGLHASAASAPVAVTVSQAMVHATADAATMIYGALTPALSGTLTGVLPRDAGKVAAIFASSAADLAPVGSYAVTATLSGSASANYQLTGGTNVGSLQIVPATASVAVRTPVASYAGLPITLTATLVSATRGTPTGAVSFFDNGSPVATASAFVGVATVVDLNPSAGAHSLTASYAGDRNFLAGGSLVASVSVSAMPDFTLAVTGSTTQAVQGGAIATYTLQVAPQSAPFSGVVSFSASGMQSGSMASFSPVNVVPGSSVVPVMMSVQTKTLALLGPKAHLKGAIQLATLVALPFAYLRRRRKLRYGAFGLLALIAICGCGARTVESSHTGQTFPLTVTATSTNLAGVVVTHAVSVNLTVE